MEFCETSTSKAAELNVLSSNAEESEIEVDDVEGNEDSSLVWCIEDDTLFYGQGLKHHSAGKGKSVYVSWNENYLLNFVFKTSSKTGATTLTKVKISMPLYDQKLEEISDILILEMNTLLYMKSGRVYYFSSVKAIHKVDWLTGIRCLTSCPVTQFSVIRFVDSSTRDCSINDKYRKLSLEVYKDVPLLGKCTSNDVLRHCYNITFDLENLFNCEWLDETYTLTSLITDDKNIVFLKQLLSIGNIFRPQDEIIDLNTNQEVHIFTISGNIFILVGAIICDNECALSNQPAEDFSIRLLNTYAGAIECVRIDCENNLLLVLLQSGHMDIWYKSNRMCGAIFHSQHEVSHFLDYDYTPSKNIFYFTTSEDIIQLRIITNNSIAVEKECIVKETRKYIGGMVACTFVEGLEQLICLSINNIFYRINFATQSEIVRNFKGNETKYENLSNLYTLNLKRVNDLRAKAQIVNELLEQPKNLHNAIEKEFLKQQILALTSKREIFKKLFQSHIEYHKNLPGLEYFNTDCVHIITTEFQNQKLSSDKIFCLIFICLKNNKNNFLSSVLTTTNWYLHISNQEESYQLRVPYETLSKKLCFIAHVSITQGVKEILPKFSMNLITFFSHRCHPICLKFNLKLETNEKTYVNLFSCIKNFKNDRGSFDIKHLIKEQPKNVFHVGNLTECVENDYKLKQYCKIPKSVLQQVMEKLKSKSYISANYFKIYYLYEYLIEMDYDDSKKILQISSKYPAAIFYIKLFLMHNVQTCNDVEFIESPLDNVLQMIMSYQSDVENLYGSLMSVESDDIPSNTISMRLETLLDMYSKLRCGFCDIK